MSTLTTAKLCVLLVASWVGQADAAQPQWFRVQRASLTPAVAADREPAGSVAPPVRAGAAPVFIWLEIELTSEGAVALKARRNMPVLVVWRQDGRAFRKAMDIGITENAFLSATRGIFRWRTWMEVPLERSGPIEAVVQDARKRFVRSVEDGAGMFRMEFSIEAGG
jgi:hypothetical protein